MTYCAAHRDGAPSISVALRSGSRTLEHGVERVGVAVDDPFMTISSFTAGLAALRLAVGEDPATDISSAARAPRRAHRLHRDDLAGVSS